MVNSSSKWLEPTSPTVEPIWVSTSIQTTADLVTSCVLTLTLCVWTAVHLNIPSYVERTQKGGFFHRITRRVKWMLVALFAPEIVLWTALNQFVEARALTIELLEIDKMEKEYKFYIAKMQTQTANNSPTIPDSSIQSVSSSIKLADQYQSALDSETAAKPDFINIAAVVAEKQGTSDRPEVQIVSNRNLKRGWKRHWHEQKLRVWTFCFPPGLEREFYIVMGGYEVHTPDVYFSSQEVRNYSPRGVIVDGEAKFMLPNQVALTPRAVIRLAQLRLLPKVTVADINDKNNADWLSKCLVCLQASWMILQSIVRKSQGLPITLLEINTIMHVMCALMMYILWLKKPQNVNQPTVLPKNIDGMVIAHILASTDWKFIPSSMQPTGMQWVDEEFGFSMLKGQGLATLGMLGKNSQMLQIVLRCNDNGQYAYGFHRKLTTELPAPSLEQITSICKLFVASPCFQLCRIPSVTASGNAATLNVNFGQYNIGQVGSSNLTVRGKLSPNFDLVDRLPRLLATIITAIYGGLHLVPWNGHFPTHLERLIWRLSGCLIASSGAMWAMFIKALVNTSASLYGLPDKYKREMQ